MSALPDLMVAPNGARRTKADHPALPISIAEIVDCAEECFVAGADGLHAHVRDEQGRHVLDAGLYQELLRELAHRIPKLAVQITTEAVGRYTPAQQRALVDAVQPRMVSVAWREMQAEDNATLIRNFYYSCAEADIAVQHILYDPEEIQHLARAIHDAQIPPITTQILLVLGRYHPQQLSCPEDLNGFIAALEQNPEISWDWSVCAFGYREQECLLAAHKFGGKMRIGFENNIWQADQKLAISNAAQVRSCMARILQQDEGADNLAYFL